MAPRIQTAVYQASSAFAHYIMVGIQTIDAKLPSHGIDTTNFKVVPCLIAPFFCDSWDAGEHRMRHMAVDIGQCLVNRIEISMCLRHGVYIYIQLPLIDRRLATRASLQKSKRRSNSAPS